jgi:hypothetical protein
MADFEQTDVVKEDVIELQVVPYGHTLGHRMGRPLFLTARRFIGICRLIESGLSTTEACRRALVTYSGFRNHVARKPLYQKRIKKAEAIRDQVWRSDALDAVHSAFAKNWPAAMTYLERRYPSEFALRNVTVQTPNRKRFKPRYPPRNLRVIEHSCLNWHAKTKRKLSLRRCRNRLATYH